MTNNTLGGAPRLSIPDLHKLVHGRVSMLQSGYLRRPKPAPSALAQLAALRSAIQQEPGAVPGIWHLTIEGLGGEEESRFAMGTDQDKPTASEQAVHLAMCLYAYHQQSRDAGMHVPKRSLASAVRLMAMGEGGDAHREKAVRRRFDALITATAFAELAYHLRGLVGQLRSADAGGTRGIGFDYARLASDLVLLQSPAYRDSVRRSWARGYYNSAASSATSTSEVIDVRNDTNDQPISEGEES